MSDSDVRPFIGEKVLWHADGAGGYAFVTEHVRQEEDGPVIRAVDTETLTEPTLMPYEYEISDHSDEMARHLADTRDHIGKVQERLRRVIEELGRRRREHDQSKLEEPEASQFAKVNDQLSSTTYGSEEYEALLDQLGEALEHHYEQYRHHPEHFEHGLAGMTLVDLVEMFVDWHAAAERHDDGDIRESIEHNQDPEDGYGYSDQLKQIFHNTADWLQDDD